MDLCSGTTSAQGKTTSHSTYLALSRNGSKAMYRILVVDDEPSVCDALRIGLTSEVFDVSSALSGKDGIALGCTENFDVIIADLCLPDIDGIEVINKIKVCQKEIISIIITAYHTTYSFDESRICGVHEYIEKPFDMRSIRKAINRWIRKRSAEGNRGRIDTSELRG